MGRRTDVVIGARRFSLGEDAEDFFLLLGRHLPACPNGVPLPLSLEAAVRGIGHRYCRISELLLPKIPVQACDDFDTDRFAMGRLGLRNETAGLPPALELLPSSDISVSSTLTIRRRIASSITISSPPPPPPLSERTPSRQETPSNSRTRR